MNCQFYLVQQLCSNAESKTTLHIVTNLSDSDSSDSFQLFGNNDNIADTLTVERPRYISMVDGRASVVLAVDSVYMCNSEWNTMLTGQNYKTCLF